MQSAAVPFEIPQSSPGMQKYLEWMEKTGGQVGELSLVGWISAALLVRGIQDAGEDFTQATVVEAINKITDWTADKIGPGINWTIAHGPPPPGQAPLACLSYLTVKDQKFEPVFVTPEQPFLCLDPNAAALSDTPIRK